MQSHRPPVGPSCEAQGSGSRRPWASALPCHSPLKERCHIAAKLTGELRMLAHAAPSDKSNYVEICSILEKLPIIRTSFRHLPTALPRSRAAGHDSSEAMTSPPQSVRCPSQQDRPGRRRPWLSDTHARRIPAPPPARRPTKILAGPRYNQFQGRCTGNVLDTRSIVVRP